MLFFLREHIFINKEATQNKNHSKTLNFYTFEILTVII